MLKRLLGNKQDRRFLMLAMPPALFLIYALVIPVITIIVISFWKTESYVIISDWNIGNYITVFTEPSYYVFFIRSFVTASIVSLTCLIIAWPCAYFIAKYGGRYRLLLVVATAAPFFTGVILRLVAFQALLGPIGLVNILLMNVGLEPLAFLMFTKTAAGIGLTYLYVPFMIVPIYLSLLNFNFELVAAAKVNGANSWSAFWEITWPLNWAGTSVGILLVFIPTLAASITPRFLGGPNGQGFGTLLGHQFNETGTWALGSAMAVVLFFVSFAVVGLVWMTIDLRRTGITKPNN